MAAHGKDAVFKIDDSSGTLRDISAHVDSVSGLPGARGLVSITAFGDAGEKSIPGLENTSFTVAGHFATTATTGSYTVLNGLRTATATSSFEYGPEGGTNGDVKASGECWMTGLTFDASVAGRVNFSASFQVDGTVSSGTFS